MGRLANLVYLIVEKVLARRTDKIVCISNAERLSALNHNIADDKKLDVIINGIDFHAIDTAQCKSRFELGIPENAFVIGMVGRISEQKSPDVFILAATYIIQHIPNAYFMIVGDGENRGEIEKMAKRKGLSLYITGWTDAPYAYMKMFDMAMLLSRWEGFGLAIVEYMAAHKNFVATHVDAIPTIVRDGIDGILVDANNPKQAADAVIKLYNDKELAAKMRESAYQFALVKYDINRVAKQHVYLFKELLNQE